MTVLAGYEIETLGEDGELDFGRVDSDGLQLVRDLTHQLYGRSP